MEPWDKHRGEESNYSGVSWKAGKEYAEASVQVPLEGRNRFTFSLCRNWASHNFRSCVGKMCTWLMFRFNLWIRNVNMNEQHKKTRSECGSSETLISMIQHSVACCREKETLAPHSCLSVVVNKLLLFTLCVTQQNALCVTLRSAKHVACLCFSLIKHLQKQFLSVFHYHASRVNMFAVSSVSFCPSARLSISGTVWNLRQDVVSARHAQTRAP